MANLPATGAITAIASNAAGQVLFEALRDWLSQLPSAPEVELTISSGTITPATRDQGSIKVETESAASSDDLANIAQTNVQDGALLLVRASVAGHTVVVKHAAGGAGQISLKYAADFSLNATDKWLLLKRVGADWVELFRSYGNDRSGERDAIGIVRTCTIAAGGTVDAITATFSPALTAHTESALLMVECAGANTSTTPTFNPNGLGAKTIVKGSNAALVAGDIPGANYLALLRYDASLDKYQLLNPAGGTAGSATLGTVVDTSTGATSYTVTGLPSGVKKIAFAYGGISTNGTASVMIRVGPSGGVVSTGYAGAVYDGTTSTPVTDGFYIDNFGAAAAIRHGRGDMQLISASTNTWSWDSKTLSSDSNRAMRSGAGTISLAGALERFQIIANGTDTFDAGKLNILYWT